MSGNTGDGLSGVCVPRCVRFSDSDCGKQVLMDDDCDEALNGKYIFSKTHEHFFL